MAIRVTLDRILLERRMSLTDLSEKVGVTLANLSILKTGKAKAIRFSTLNALCRVLECQPGELLSYEPSEDDAELGRRPPIKWLNAGNRSQEVLRMILTCANSGPRRQGDLGCVEKNGRGRCGPNGRWR